MAGSRRWVAAAGLAGLLLSACATVPDSGSVQQGRVALTTGGGQGQDYLRLIARSPQPGWTAKQVVEGFLTACASFAGNHAIARQYLTPGVRKKWSPEWAVTVVGATTLTKLQNSPHQAGPSIQVDWVKATGEKLATLTNTGQYRGAAGSNAYTFHLLKVAGQWRIENPANNLLLTEPDFKLVYAPRNLYYVASPAHVLVPDPVFVPLQATTADLANKLATALLQPPPGWLASGVSTAFPAGARLLGVTLNDGTATIDLGGAAAHASPAVLDNMASQLVWTLAGRSYGQSAVQSIQLEINGHLRRSASLSGGSPGLSVPQAPAHVPLYSLAGNGAVQERTVSAPTPGPVAGEAGEGRVRLTTIAVSPRNQYVAGFSRSRQVVYYGPMRRGARLTTWRVHGGGVTSLSWDVRGDLWVASPNGVFLLPPGSSGKAKGIRLGLGQPIRVSQLRVAPDGVRVAMIVSGPGRRGNHLLLAAVNWGPDGPSLGAPVSIGTDVSDPTQLTWYDADNLIVLSRSSAGPEMQEVPVNGGSSTPIGPDPGTQSITAAGPGYPMAAGLAGGKLAVESSLNGTWASQPGVAWSPVYPG